MLKTFFRVLVLILAATVARADEPLLVSGNVPYIDAALGESKYIGFGVALDSGWCFAGGAALAMDDGTVSAGSYVYGQRMVVNKPRFAAGPSLTIETNWEDTMALYLGLQLYYLLVEGVALGVQPALMATFGDSPPALKLGTLALVLSYSLPSPW